MLLDIVDDVMDISKIEAGKFVLDPIDFDPEEVFTKVTSFWSARAAQKDLSLTLEFTGSAAFPYLHGDVRCLKQILNNTLSNAIKFTVTGGIVVRGMVTTTPDGAPALRFSVHDSGVGIPEDRQQAVFSAFEQADRSTTRQYGGTGLGLSIVARLTKLMGGTVELASEMQQGTVFNFGLPLAAGRLPASLASGTGLALPAKFDRILIVDDIETNRMVLSGLLKPYCDAIVIAENGLQAVEMCEADAFELIFMDYHMPKMDGIEATKRIRQGGGVNAETKIVALTAEAMVENISQFLAAGMDLYLSKPLTRDGLVDCLRQIRAGSETDAGTRRQRV